ncbi:MAG: BadF/BadG/BcrA/BcrD ATPase family protein [bacterium]
MKYVIGMDGGGTKTIAALSDEHGTVLAAETLGPSNFQIIGVEKAAQVLVNLILRCAKQERCEIKDIRSVVAGLTGAGRDVDEERMRKGFLKELRKSGISLKNVAIESDARIALEGAFKGNPGIILIAGTGSIAFGKDGKGTIHRTGGWGRILGDEGSGYTLGREALNAVTKHLDGRGASTILTGMVSRKFKLSDQVSIIHAVYRDFFDIASIAPLVIKAAEQHDVIAARILNNAVSDLTEHVRALLTTVQGKAGSASPVSLAFIGSVASTDNLLSTILFNCITTSFPQVSIIKPQTPPVYGAVLLAMQNLGKRS